MRSIPALFLSLLLANAALAEVLFPAPLHITREITDPVAGSKTVIDDYCHGNRVVSVIGRRTAIAEYDRNVVTTIDFDAGTYSVTKFDDLAKAWEGRLAPPRNAELRDAPQWQIAQKGARVVASRPGEAIEARLGGQFVQLTADTQLRLSRAAAEVLLGVAYPNRPDPAADVLLDALRSGRSRIAGNAEMNYALPLEHVIRHELDGEVVELRNVVVRVGNELPPSEVMAVPAGARLVESDAVAARRIGDELDGLRKAQP